jgi:hypothetical protein
VERVIPECKLVGRDNQVLLFAHFEISLTLISINSFKLYVPMPPFNTNAMNIKFKTFVCIFLILFSFESYCQEMAYPETYSGETRNAKPNGKGTLIFNDGSKYVGDFQNGKSHGKGTFYAANGSRYVGEWQNGFMHGSGTFYFPKEHKYKKYVGEFVNHKMSGKGKIIKQDGGSWEGEFKNGTMNGWGILKYPFGGSNKVLYINGKHVTDDINSDNK